MLQLREAWEAVNAFFELGGDVLLAIFVVTLLMWVLIAERLLYFGRPYRQEAEEFLQKWQSRSDKASWYARQIRNQLASMIRQRLNHALPMVKTLVALCPLLGLLGTVTGMIEVFDVMAVAGSGNPRAMASGVSRATIPTMAGMVAALSGLYFSVRLQRTADKESRRFADRLTEV